MEAGSSPFPREDSFSDIILADTTGSQGKIYVAGIDIAGETEEAEDTSLRSLRPRQDSTVITIGELDFPAKTGGRGPETAPQSSVAGLLKQPTIRVIQHYWFTGKPHSTLYPQLVDILKSVWDCKKVVVDATGMGQPVASFLRQALGSRIESFTFTQPSKSQLGFGLLAAINSGRLKMYATDGSPEYQEFWFEIERAKSLYRPNQTMSFSVDSSEGHDDFLLSLALVVGAANRYQPRNARGTK